MIFIGFAGFCIWYFFANSIFLRSESGEGSVFIMSELVK
jgi:hypothetical protein